MADEHVHAWERVPGYVSAQQHHCADCGAYRTVVKGVGTKRETGPVLGGRDVIVEELEQQLREVYDELEMTSEHLKDARHYVVYQREVLAQARALLEQALDEWIYGPLEDKIRAYLAQQEKQDGG
ncbi:MAG TPA: hypothetical protein VH599_13430 [Ktedonobacterales bacterium]|jgi:recombinational DNA repair protein (RecF pathway)